MEGNASLGSGEKQSSSKLQLGVVFSGKRWKAARVTISLPYPTIALQKSNGDQRRHGGPSRVLPGAPLRRS